MNTIFSNPVQELVDFPSTIKAILVDSDGNHIENPGTESTADGLCSVVNPWEMSVSLSGGSAMLSGTTTVSFSGGVAEFTDLNIDKEGSGYSLTFVISQSSQGNAVSPLTLELPDVGIRPLSFKVTSSPSLEKQGETFSSDVVVKLWDDVNNLKAGSALVSKVGDVNCEISLGTGNAVLSGTTTVAMTSKLLTTKSALL